MKKIILSIGLVISFISMSCTKLDEKLYTEVDVSNFGASKAEVESIVGRGYATLRGHQIPNTQSWNAPFEFLFFCNEVASDEACIPVRNPGDNWNDGGIFLDLQRHTFNPQTEHLYRSWLYCYTGIASINYAIWFIDNSKVISATDKKTYDAELRGLRAYYYYRLMDYFGNVPLQIVYPDYVFKTNSTRSEIYKFIVSELEEIGPYAPEKGYGKFTKGVAYTLLARVYLNAKVFSGTEQWDKCLEACNKVKGFILEPNFKTNFLKANEVSKENIFVVPYDEVQFANLDNGGNYQQNLLLDYNSDKQFGNKSWYVNGMCAEPNILGKYEDADIRKQCLAYGPQFIIGTTTPVYERNRPKVQLDYTSEIGNIENTTENVGVRMIKYEITKNDKACKSNDYVLMRYAEVIMMKAECYLRKGDAASAQPLVAQIRSRAGLTTPANIDLDFLNDELLREFLFEEHRRTDNIRFGTFGKAGWEMPGSDTNKELFPIPAKCLIENPKLVQNPGY